VADIVKCSPTAIIAWVCEGGATLCGQTALNPYKQNIFSPRRAIKN
jgi:hypothetical protein